MRGRKRDLGHSHSKEPEARGLPPVLSGLGLPLPMSPTPSTASLGLTGQGGRQGQSRAQCVLQLTEEEMGMIWLDISSNSLITQQSRPAREVALHWTPGIPEAGDWSP